MVEVGTSDIFDDAEGQIARLEARIAEVREEIAASADPDRQGRLRWWIYGAERAIRQHRSVLAQRAAGEHTFVTHEATPRRLWAVCSCGARFLGEMHEDFTLEEFPNLPGHVRGPA